MSLSLSIIPLASDLDVYGPPDVSSAYSLSGHIILSVASSAFFFEPRRTARIRLTSLTLTFEGQSETYTHATGYGGVRLCSLTRDIATAEPIELSNEGPEDGSEPSEWNVVFNLPIPGWLPASNYYDDEELGVQYALYVNATYVNLDQGHSSWGFPSLCSVFRSRVRSVVARKVINLRRFMSAPSASPVVSPLLNYLVHTPSVFKVQDKKSIPPEVLLKIHVLASLPEYIDMEAQTIPLTLRMRTKGLDEEHCRKLQVKEIMIDLHQKEKCRHHPSPTYLSTWPLPSQKLQPPNVPLRHPHLLSTIQDDAGLFTGSLSETTSRSFSLLPPDESGSYSLEGDNYVFANDGILAPVPTWYTISTEIPFVHNVSFPDASVNEEWAECPSLRPTATGPLSSVYHDLSITLTCSYDMAREEGNVLLERLQFNIPVTFGRSAPVLPPLQNMTPLVDAATVVTATAVANMVNLPAYSQLYDANGDRKIDYTVSLPLYCARAEEGSAIPDLQS